MEAAAATPAPAPAVSSASLNLHELQGDPVLSELATWLTSSERHLVRNAVQQMATLTEAKEDKDIRDKVGTAGLVPLLVQLLDIDEELVVLHVCRTLFHLARSKENRLLILNAQGVTRLLHLLTSNAGQELKRSAVLALLNLASVEPVRKELRDARGFQHVAWLMQAVTPNTKAPEVLLEYSCRLLSMMLLSTKPKAAAVSKAAARQAGLLELLLYQMKLWGESEQEAPGVTTVSYAALALSRLVTGSEKNHELLREHGGLELLVQLLWAYHVQTERQGITRQEWQLRLTLVGHLMGVLAGAHHPESKEILRASGGVEVLAGVLLDTATTLHDAPDRSDDAVLHAIVWDACLALRNVVSGRVPAQLKLLEMNLIPALLYLLGDDSAQKAAAAALASLGAHTKVQEALREGDALPQLLHLVLHPDPAVAKNIAIVLRNMCTRSSPDASAVEGVLYTWEAIVQHGADLPMEMLLGPAAMPAVSRSYGVEVYQPAGPPARAAHAAVHDHNQQWADGHAPPMEDDMSLYSVQTADTNQGGGGGGGSPGRDTGEKKAGMIARIKSARPMSARKMLDAASSIGAALRTSFQNLPIPSNLPAPRQAFADPGANEPPGFQPSVSTPAPSIPNSPAVSAQPASWAAPPQPPSPPLGAAAAASSPSVSGLRDEEDAHADDVPVLATPPHVKTPRTPRPLPKETSPAPDLASGGTSETSPATEATEPKPEPAQMQAEEEATDTESMPSRPMSRLDQLEQMLNDMTARPPKRAEFKINKPTTETAIEKVAGKNAVGADAAGTEAAGAEAAGAVAAEACAVPAEAVGAPLVAEKTVVEETAEGAVVTSAGLVGEAAVGKGVDAERAEVARRVQLPAGDSQDAISSESSVGSEQARASKDASTAQANDGGTDSCTASVARAEPVDGGTPANSAQASSQARAECADGAAPAGLAGVETQPPPTAVQEPAVTTPSKPRPPSSRLSIDRPITPGPQDLLRLEQSFDSMPKLEGESEMTRRARSSFSSVASPSGSASTSLKRWQRAISFEAEVAADLAQAAAPRPKSPPAHTASSPRMQQPERQEKSPGLCSPAAVLPSPSPATVQASRPDFLDSDSDDDGTAGVPLFGSALKGSDTPSRKKKPVKQATRKLVFASGDGLASDPAGGRAQTEVVSSPPEPTEGVPRPQRSSSHQSRASASTLSTLLGPAGATSTTTKAEAVADPSIESELSGLNPEKSVLEYDEEEEDNFLRDWHKSREGRQARMDHARSYLERDSESVAVMDELRRMEAEGTGAGGAGAPGLSHAATANSVGAAAAPAKSAWEQLGAVWVVGGVFVPELPLGLQQGGTMPAVLTGTEFALREHRQIRSRHAAANATPNSGAGKQTLRSSGPASNSGVSPIHLPAGTSRSPDSAHARPSTADSESWLRGNSV